VVAALR